MSDSRPQGRQNWAEKVFAGVPVGPGEADLFGSFLAAHDFAPGTVKAFALDCISSPGGSPTPTASRSPRSG
jgi:hypothetical protein